MAELHVVPDGRAATWRIQDERGRVSRFGHPNATDAEFEARAQAVARAVDEVVVHDRYGRTRRAVRRGDGWCGVQP